MSIKRKLQIILCVIGAILTLIAGLVLWNTMAINRQVEIITPAIDDLREISGIRTRFYRQMYYMAHYLIFGGEESRQDYESLSRGIKSSLHTLSVPVNTHVHSHETFRKTEQTFDGLLGIMRRALLLKESGKTDEAAHVINTEAETFIDDVFLKEIDEAARGEIEEIYGAYREILIRLGSMPWVTKRSLRQMKVAETSIQYFIAVDRVGAAVNRQVNELMMHLALGSERSRQKFLEYGFAVKRALAETNDIIQAQKVLGMEGEESDQKLIKTAGGKYFEVMSLAEKASALKKAGKAREALRFFEEKAAFLIDSVLLSSIEAAVYDSKEEIADAHRLVAKSALSAAATGVVMISAVALILFSIFQRLLRRIIAGIGSLRTGTEIIGAGNLDHKMEIRSDDELGELAGSFNRMTASLKESNEDLRSFAYIISHDLRAPLVNIKGFSGELRGSLKEIISALNGCASCSVGKDVSRLKSVLGKDVPEALGFIESSSERMGALINAILKFSRMGRRELAPETIDMNALVQSALKFFAHLIEEGRITVKVGALPQIVADRMSIEVIMGNLLDNSIKYIVQGRPVEIAVTSEKIEAETAFHISDNGRGIAKDDIPRVFEIFRRAGKQDVPGEGMGLAYVKALVRRHGGRIWCESEPGVGTTFSFAIPAGAEKLKGIGGALS